MHLKSLATPAKPLAQIMRDVDFRNERDLKFVMGAHLLYFRSGNMQ